MMIGDLDYIEEQGGHVFECNKVRSNPTPPAMDQGHTPASITQPKGWETDFFDDVRSRPPASAHRGRITSIPTQLTTARCKYFPATFPVIQARGRPMNHRSTNPPTRTFFVTGARRGDHPRVQHEEVPPSHPGARPVHREHQGRRQGIRGAQVDEEDRRPQAGVPGGEGQPQDLPTRAGVCDEARGEEAVHRRPPVRPGHLQALHPHHLHDAQGASQEEHGGRRRRAAEVLGQVQGARRGAGALVPARRGAGGPPRRRSPRSSPPRRRSPRSSPPVPSPTRSRARSPTLKTAPTPRFSRRRPPRILSPLPLRLRHPPPTPSTTPSPLRCPCPRAPARASTADPAR